MKTSTELKKWAEQVKEARGDLSQSQAAKKISPLLSVKVFQAWEQGVNEPPDWTHKFILSSLKKSK